MYFNIYRVPVRIHPVFWFVAILIGALNSSSPLGIFIWTVVVFVSVMVHELGHALTALFFGQKAKIELFGLGGVTQRKGPPLRKWQEFLIVLAGPLFGFALAFLSLMILVRMKDQNSPLFYALSIGYVVNLFWTILNLFPVLPLDGGQLVRIFFESLFGFRGMKISFLFSMALASVCGIAFMSYQFFLAGAIFFMLAFENFRSFQALRGAIAKDHDSELQKELQKAEQAKKIGDIDEAQKLFQQVREKTAKGLLFTSATESLADLLYHLEKKQEAWQLLNSLGDNLSPEGMKTLSFAAYETDKIDEARDVATKLYQYVPSGKTAVLLAKCHARKEEADAAVGWIRRALHDGYPDIEDALADKAFDPIRKSLEFQTLFEG